MSAGGCCRYGRRYLCRRKHPQQRTTICHRQPISRQWRRLSQRRTPEPEDLCRATCTGSRHTVARGAGPSAAATRKAAPHRAPLVPEEAPAAAPAAAGEKPRFGINSLIGRMTGSNESAGGEARPARQQPPVQTGARPHQPLRQSLQKRWTRIRNGLKFQPSCAVKRTDLFYLNFTERAAVQRPFFRLRTACRHWWRCLDTKSIVSRCFRPLQRLSCVSGPQPIGLLRNKGVTGWAQCRRQSKDQSHLQDVGCILGKPVRLTIRPAMAEHGIWFCRTDIENGDTMIPARYDVVHQSPLCTTLVGEAGVSVGTVEHVMAALAGLRRAQRAG